MFLSLTTFFIFLSSVFHGILGFGFNIALTIFLFYFLTPIEIFALGITYALIINLPMAIFYFKYIDFYLFKYLVSSGILGCLIGLNLFLSLSNSVLKGLILVTYSLAIFLLLNKPFVKISVSKYSTSFIGFISGFIGGLMCLPGFVLSLFLNQTKISKDKFKGTLATFFVIIDLLIIVVYFNNNIIYYDRLREYLYYFPCVISGLILGVFLTRFFSDDMFEKLVYIFLCLIVLVNFLILLF